MPWWSRRRPPTRNTPAARVAAVQPLTADWPRVATRTRQPWQDRARFFAEQLGVIRFANGLAAQTAARCELRVEVLRPTGEWEPVDNEPQVTDLLATYQGPDADTPGDLVARHVWHYKTVGEAFQVVDQDPATGELTWSIRSTRAVQFRSGYALVMDLPGGSVRDGSARELPIEQVRRLWVPDDEWVMHAKSPMRGVLNDCERYWSLARRIRREAESVLTNGFLWTPGYAHKPARPQMVPGDKPPSQFDLDYYAVAEQAWMDDDSVQAIAPLSVHYDHQDSNKEPTPPAFINPGRDMDGKGIEYRQEALEAIARGLDLPMGLAVSGAGGGNSHWGDWLQAEDDFKSNIAPTMDRVTHTDMTVSFLRPVLRELAAQARWAGNPDVYRVGYDPTDVIIHPDRAASSIALYGLGLIQGSIVMESNGFQATDMPDPAELARIMETIRARQTAPVGGPERGTDMLAVGPSTTKELPPAPAMAALGPYPCETSDWLD